MLSFILTDAEPEIAQTANVNIRFIDYKIFNGYVKR